MLSPYQEPLTIHWQSINSISFLFISSTVYVRIIHGWLIEMSGSKLETPGSKSTCSAWKLQRSKPRSYCFGSAPSDSKVSPLTSAVGPARPRFFICWKLKRENFKTSFQNVSLMFPGWWRGRVQCLRWFAQAGSKALQKRSLKHVRLSVEGTPEPSNDSSYLMKSSNIGIQPSIYCPYPCFPFAQHPVFASRCSCRLH